MALGKTYVMGLVKKAPKPDELEAMGDMADDSKSPDDSEEEPKPKDEDGDEGARASAFDDFVSALGISGAKAEKARTALDEYLSLCTPSK